MVPPDYTVDFLTSVQISVPSVRSSQRPQAESSQQSLEQLGNRKLVCFSKFLNAMYLSASAELHDRGRFRAPTSQDLSDCDGLARCGYPITRNPPPRVLDHSVLSLPQGLRHPGLFEEFSHLETPSRVSHPRKTGNHFGDSLEPLYMKIQARILCTFLFFAGMELSGWALLCCGPLLNFLTYRTCSTRAL